MRQAHLSSDGEDYVALLGFLKTGKVTVVGWSDGGIIGLDMAMNHPDLLVGCSRRRPTSHRTA